MNKYELQVGEFSGPLEKLLELIEEKKLEITSINLGEVTADFLKHLQTIQDIHPRLLADFVSVAGKLILIKSKALLPGLELTEEEEEDIKDLELRLKLYKQFKEAQENLKSNWNKSGIAYARPLMQNLPPVFRISDKVTPEALDVSISKLLANLQKENLKTESVKLTIIDVEEKVKELISRVEHELESNFKDMSKDKPREEIVALFLALLMLFKDNLIKITQDDSFSDIVITKQEAV